MKIVEYADVPDRFDEILNLVDFERMTIKIRKDGRAIEPVDEATMALFDSGGIPEA